MTFCEFAQKLYPIVGGGSNTHAFVKTLFESIVSENGVSVLDDYTKESFKAYYNGNTEITRLAKKLMPYIDPSAFTEFIYGFDDSPIDELCLAFEDDIPGIDKFNAGEELADFFVSILKESAAIQKRQRTMKQGKDKEKNINSEDTDEDEDDDSNEKESVIQQQNNIIQNGEKNVNLINNDGTINFNL